MMAVKEKAFLINVNQLKEEIHRLTEFEKKVKGYEEKEKEIQKVKSDLKILEDLNKEKIDNVVQLTKEKDKIKKENDNLRYEISYYDSLIQKLEKSGVKIQNDRITPQFKRDNRRSHKQSINPSSLFNNFLNTEQENTNYVVKYSMAKSEK